MSGCSSSLAGAEIALGTSISGPTIQGVPTSLLRAGGGERTHLPQTGRSTAAGPRDLSRVTWSLGSGELFQPMMETDGRAVTESNLSLRATARPFLRRARRGRGRRHNGHRLRRAEQAILCSSPTLLSCQPLKQASNHTSDACRWPRSVRVCGLGVCDDPVREIRVGTGQQDGALGVKSCGSVRACISQDHHGRRRRAFR
jgi:hypothetical protein